MRTVLAVVLLLVVGLAVWGGYQGWVKMTKTEDQTTIRIDKKEAREAVEEAADEGRALLHEAGEAVREAGEELRDATRKDEDGTP